MIYLMTRYGYTTKLISALRAKEMDCIVLWSSYNASITIYNASNQYTKSIFHVLRFECPIDIVLY